MFVKKKDFDALHDIVYTQGHRIRVLEIREERYKKIVHGLLDYFELNTYDMPATPEHTKIYKKFGPEPPEV